MAKEIKNIIKKGLGTRLRENMGISEPEPVQKTEKEKEYAKSLIKKNIEEEKFNAKKVYNNFCYYAKVISNKPFVIDEENLDLIKLLSLYFSKDDRFKTFDCNNKTVSIINEPDFDKGIMIFGNIGFGKSLIMKIFKNISIPGNRFYYHESNDIVMDYSKNGYEGLQNYFISNCYYDDIGTEEKASHYEKGKEIFKTIIEHRYNQFLNQGLKTHFTSNLDPEDLKVKYGDRVHSRLNEMFNIIVVDGTDRRK